MSSILIKNDDFKIQKQVSEDTSDFWSVCKKFKSRLTHVNWTRQKFLPNCVLNLTAKIVFFLFDILFVTFLSSRLDLLAISSVELNKK